MFFQEFSILCSRSYYNIVSKRKLRIYFLEPEKNTKLYSLVMHCPFTGKKKNLGEIKKKRQPYHCERRWKFCKRVYRWAINWCRQMNAVISNLLCQDSFLPQIQFRIHFVKPLHMKFCGYFYMYIKTKQNTFDDTEDKRGGGDTYPSTPRHCKKTCRQKE